MNKNSNIHNGATLLRKLTRKSVIQFGQYEGHSIQDCLSFQRYSYLRHIYFCYSKMTFTDDILEEIGITEEWRITKPGVDKEKFLEIQKIKLGKCSLKTKKHLEKREKVKHIIIGKLNNHKFSAKALQMRNHGK